MLTYSIPAYRLPKCRRASPDCGPGGRWASSSNWASTSAATGSTLHDLRARYASVFLATGLWHGKKLRLERGELLDSGLEFLIDLQRGVERPVGERVLVIGGGSVAVDVAITARRLVRGRCRWPAWRAWTKCPPSRRTSSRRTRRGSRSCPRGGRSVSRGAGWQAAGMELVRCRSVFDQDGRFAPAFDPAVTTVFEADQVLGRHRAGCGPSRTPSRRCGRARVIASDKRTAATSIEGVFAGGDVTGGPATLVQAMAAGQRAAPPSTRISPAVQLDAAPDGRARSH